MKSFKTLFIIILVFSLSLLTLAGCGALKSETQSAGTDNTQAAADTENTQTAKTGKTYDKVSAEIKLSGSSAQIKGSGAKAEGGNIIISEGGAYSFSGKLDSGKITVDAADEDVTLILSGAEITSPDSAAINVFKAGTVTVEVADGTENTLSDAAKYVYEDSYSDKEKEEPSACVFSKSDLIITGGGNLTVKGNAGNGIRSNDWMTVENTALTVESENTALFGNDGVTVNGVTLTASAKGDGIHSDGDVEINAGKLTIKSDDDGIHADSSVKINGGDINITAHEGIEGTLVTINDGIITLSASDDGINAAQKVDGVTPTVEINGGEITVTMGAGDTDAIDSNGDIVINGGKINITAQSGFDYEGKAELNGGEVNLNGEKISEITNQFGGGMRGFGGRDGNFPQGEKGGFFKGGTPPTDENGEAFRGTPPTDEYGEAIRGGRQRGFPGEGENPAPQEPGTQSQEPATQGTAV